MTTFTVHEAKTNLSKLIAKVLAGEEVIIAKGKEPAVKLVPVTTVIERPLLGRYKNKIVLGDAFFEALPDDELDAWGMI